MAGMQQFLQMMQDQQQRCGPLYDAIENEDFELAIKLGNSRELRSFPLAQALLGYSYASTRNYSNALDSVRLAMRNLPTDEGAINAIQHTLRMCNHEEELGPFYESLLAKWPQNAPVFLSLLFNFYTKQGDGKKMQNTAQKLYKTTGDRKFQFWSVASMLQQDSLPPMMLTIAEKTLAKIFFPAPGVDEGEADSDRGSLQPGAEEIELYLEVLKRQNRMKDALTALDSLYGRPRGVKTSTHPLVDEASFKENGSSVKMHELRYRSLRISLCKSLLEDASSSPNSAGDGDYLAEIKREHRAILVSYPDQWDSHEELARVAATGCAVVGSSPSLSPSLATASVLEHRSFLKTMQSEYPSLRGPYLAEFSLLALWADNYESGEELPVGWENTALPRDYPSHDDASSVLLNLTGLLCAFLDRFQSKQCCFGDIKGNMDFIIGHGGPAGKRLMRDLSSWAWSRASEIRKDTKMLLQEVSTDRERAIEAHPAREECINLVCSLSKMAQVAVYAQSLLSSGSKMRASGTEVGEDAASDVDLARLQLHLGTKSFCSGGVGGEREVQPADEVLLLSSSRWRQEATSVFHNESEMAEATSYLATNASWGVFLAASLAASPFSHAFKIEMLEPLRSLAVGKKSADLFESLGTRHVQADSMSYLVVPTLLESGMFQEAYRRHITVCGFHRHAVRDTGDMIGRSFEHCNYAKCLEMKRFLSLCQTSLQLAVSRSELPALELLEQPQYSDIDEACKYLDKMCTDADKDETPNHLHLPLLSREELAALSDNCDYGILVQCDASREEEVMDAAARRKDMEYRIREAQLATRVLSCTLNAEHRRASELLDDLVACVSSRGVVITMEGCAIDYSDGSAIDKAAVNLIETLKSQQEPTQVMSSSQVVRMGPAVFEACLYRCLIACYRFSIACQATLEAVLALDPDGNGTDILESAEGKITTVRAEAGQLLACMAALLKALHLNKPFISVNGVEIANVVLIRCAAGFVRIMGMGMALTIKAATKSFPAAEKKIASSRGYKDSNATGTYGKIFLDVASIIKMVQSKGLELTNEVASVLEVASKHTRGFHRLNPHPLFACTPTPSSAEADADHELNEAASALKDATTTLSQEVLASYELSYQRLTGYLKKIQTIMTE